MFYRALKVSQLTVLEKPNHEVKSCLQSPETGLYGGTELGEGCTEGAQHSGLHRSETTRPETEQGTRFSDRMKKIDNCSLILRYRSSSARDGRYSEAGCPPRPQGAHPTAARCGVFLQWLGDGGWSGFEGHGREKPDPKGSERQTAMKVHLPERH